MADDRPLTSGHTGFGALTDNPAWSPDGAKLAFTRQSIDFNRGTLIWEVYTIFAGGTGDTRVTDTADELEHHPVW